MVQKPTSIQRMETMKALVEVINESKLPAFVLVPILENILAEAKKGMELELKHDREEYEKLQKEETLRDCAQSSGVASGAAAATTGVTDLG